MPKKHSFSHRHGEQRISRELYSLGSSRPTRGPYLVEMMTIFSEKKNGVALWENTVQQRIKDSESKKGFEKREIGRGGFKGSVSQHREEKESDDRKDVTK